MLFIHKKTCIETVLLPLVLLGAFGYHLLFEGKSQYIVTYIPLLVPTAAYAFNTMLCGKYEKVKQVVGRINHIPDKAVDLKRFPKPTSITKSSTKARPKAKPKKK